MYYWKDNYLFKTPKIDTSKRLIPIDSECKKALTWIKDIIPFLIDKLSMHKFKHTFTAGCLDKDIST